jgi:pyruvate,orthophosphate dikinase
MAACEVLERENGDVQDIEFTVERGKLYLLQSRAAKRSPAAAVRCAVDMVREGRIDVDDALQRVSAEQVRMLLRPRLAAGIDLASAHVVARGEAASPGVGVGVVVADADEAERVAASGARVVLARPTTSPEDVHGMLVADAVITERGGSTSHAAVVSRQLGVPCVVGCGEGALAGLVGSTVTVDGSSGRVFGGALPVDHPDEDHDPLLGEIKRWAETRTPMRVLGPQAAHPPDVTDLDQLPGGEDLARAKELLQGVKCAAGSVLNTDEGVRLALDAGVDLIVVRQVLPALLAAIAAQRSTGQA